MSTHSAPYLWGRGVYHWPNICQIPVCKRRNFNLAGQQCLSSFPGLRNGMRVNTRHNHRIMVVKGHMYRKSMPLHKTANCLPLAAPFCRLIVKMG